MRTTVAYTEGVSKRGLDLTRFVDITSTDKRCEDTPATPLACTSIPHNLVVPECQRTPGWEPLGRKLGSAGPPGVRACSFSVRAAVSRSPGMW